MSAPCGYDLVHRGHDHLTHEQVGNTDGWVPVVLWCEGNDDQDDPLFRFECCVHCASRICPTRDGHGERCRHEDCLAGTTMLGEPGPPVVGVGPSLAQVNA